MKNKNSKKIEKQRLDSLKIDVGLQILELRILRNVTQGVLAKMIGTQQPSIARAERGATTPSIDFLNKIAVALQTELIPPKFALVEANDARYQHEKAHIKYKFETPTTTHHIEGAKNTISISSNSPETRATELSFVV